MNLIEMISHAVYLNMHGPANHNAMPWMTQTGITRDSGSFGFGFAVVVFPRNPFEGMSEAAMKALEEENLL